LRGNAERERGGGREGSREALWKTGDGRDLNNEKNCVWREVTRNHLIKKFWCNKKDFGHLITGK
jgi:hypothetical protein